MSGSNTGILINAYPLTAEQIAEIEAEIFTTPGNTYAFLTDTRELCFALNSGVDIIKQHAWHWAWELSIEDGVYVKRIYKKKSRIEYYLWKTLYKNSLEEAWPSLEPELPQIEPPAVIVLDGDTLNIFDESGLATSATIFVNGEPMATVSHEEEPLDPAFNHYGVIPQGCNYYSMTSSFDGVEGDAFPELSDGDSYIAGGLVYYCQDGQWECTEGETGGDDNVIILESINGAPVTNICGIYHGATGDLNGLNFNGDRTTLVTIPKSINIIQTGAFLNCTNLANITFTGTVDQWNSIELGEGWNYMCPEITVTCTDGTVTVPAYGA